MTALPPEMPDCRPYCRVDLQQVLDLALLLPDRDGDVIRLLVEDVMHLIRNRLQSDMAARFIHQATQEMKERIAACRCQPPERPRKEPREWR